MKRTFVFNGYDVNEKKGEVNFHYIVKSPDQSIDFTEKLSFPNADFSEVPKELLANLLHNLSLILGISYWKLYCPKRIEIRDNFLTKEQAEFWNSVYTKGLGEFFYKNQIDFRELIQFPYDYTIFPKTVDFPRKDRALLMLGGGKDSIVAGELLKENNKEFTAFVVNDYPIQRGIIKLLHVDAITVKREIDPKLLEMNRVEAVYNGHVPISAIYAFIVFLAAALYDYQYVISSNEASANYGNVEYLGEEINHQWSKSFEFEKLFQDYIKMYLTSSIYYFSLLRPLYEIKITQLFAKYPKYFSTFSSCNRNFTISKLHSGSVTKIWCGECPKCAFIFVTLAAFLSKEEVVKIFGKNLFADGLLIDTYKELLGIKDLKPFECVGTSEEIKIAFYFARRRGEFKNDIAMQMFEKEVLPNLQNVGDVERNLLSAQRGELLPIEFIPMIITV